jgi:hypothetical protein
MGNDSGSHRKPGGVLVDIGTSDTALHTNSPTVGFTVGAKSKAAAAAVISNFSQHFEGRFRFRDYI